MSFVSTLHWQTSFKSCRCFYWCWRRPYNSCKESAVERVLKHQVEDVILTFNIWNSTIMCCFGDPIVYCPLGIFSSELHGFAMLHGFAVCYGKKINVLDLVRCCFPLLILKALAVNIMKSLNFLWTVKQEKTLSIEVL